MDLIYGQFKNEHIEDINVLQDYSYDAVVGVGKDANDFECRVQEYNNKCVADNVLYIEFTEYGGIIDRVEHDSKSGEIIYKGRTWHGIMNSHVLPRKTYSGEINEIISQMLIDADLDYLFTCDLIPPEERTIEINSFEVSYMKVYDAIIKLLQDDRLGGCKLVMYFYDGMVHLGAVMNVDYSIDEEFDTSKTPYRTGRTENTVNHLICLGQGEGADRAVIHLFTDDISQDLTRKLHIQPYTLKDNPEQDSDYIRDERNKVMFGKDEITEILDVPNSEIITNYPPLNDRPTDWNTEYFNKYYEDSVDEETGEVRKTKIKEIVRDEFRRVDRNTAPDGWTNNFSEYYKWDDTKAGGDRYIFKDGTKTIVKARESDGIPERDSGGMVSVRERSESELTVGNGISYPEVAQANAPDDWISNYSSYYTRQGSSGYESVSPKTIDVYGNSIADVGGDNNGYLTNNAQLHNGNSFNQPPEDWGWNFGNYYTRNKNAVNDWIYTQVQGIAQYEMIQVTRKSAPTNWKNEWSNYYYKVSHNVAKKGKYIEVNGGYYVTASDAVSLKKLSKQSNEKPYPKYQPKHFYVKYDKPALAPTFSKIKNGVFQKFSFQVAPAWEYPTKHYYRKVIDTIPVWSSGTYYTLAEDVRQVPNFYGKTYYKAVQDRLRRLVEKGIEELKKLNDKDTLDMSLELDSNYDVLDVMGLTDDVTNVPIRKPILRKIVKIKKDILSVEYEMD